MIDKFYGKYRFLSNFGEGQIEYEGEVYLTSEHFFQAAKTIDDAEQKFVRIAPTPGEAKKRGKKITMREDWDEVKDGIMRKALRLKFEQNPELAKKLLATGDQKLVEGNTWGDTYWGVCFGSGENKLGLLLEELRAVLQERQRSHFQGLASDPLTDF